jgi:hypothetical protein
MAARAFLVLVWLNLLTCFLGSKYFGGDALNGHTENGRYFLSDHGGLTEVSAAVFTFSWWHHASLFAMIPLAIVGWVLSTNMSVGRAEIDAKAKRLVPLTLCYDNLRTRVRVGSIVTRALSTSWPAFLRSKRSI